MIHDQAYIYPRREKIMQHEFINDEMNELQDLLNMIQQISTHKQDVEVCI